MLAPFHSAINARNTLDRRLVEALARDGAANALGPVTARLADMLTVALRRVTGRGGGPSRPGEPPRVRTGRLTTTLYAQAAAPGRIRVHSGVVYGRMLEHGTRRMEARPFVRPAIQLVRQRVIEALRQSMAGALRRRAGGG
jgi:HK97 gp10 family phage protein